jgi:uncharacterized protein (TIGR00251 family)
VPSGNKTCYNICMKKAIGIAKPATVVAEQLPSYLSQHRNGGSVLAIRAKPTGKRNRIADVSGVALEVELAAKPQNGEANSELIDYLSDVLRIRKKDVQLISGDRCRDKQVLIGADILTLQSIKELIEAEYND